MDSSSDLATGFPSQDKLDLQYEASHHTTLSEDFTGTCLNLNSVPARRSQSQALSQSTVCGPLKQHDQKQLQSASGKRGRDESTGFDSKSNKRPFTLQVTHDESSKESDDCDGEEEVQSNYKAADQAKAMPLQSNFPMPKPAKPQRKHQDARHNNMSHINFPVLRRASAGCKAQVCIPHFICSSMTIFQLPQSY